LIRTITLQHEDEVKGIIIAVAAKESKLYNSYLFNRDHGIQVEITRIPENKCPDTQFVKDVLKFVRKAK